MRYIYLSTIVQSSIIRVKLVAIIEYTLITILTIFILNISPLISRITIK